MLRAASGASMALSLRALALAGFFALAAPGFAASALAQDAPLTMPTPGGAPAPEPSATTAPEATGPEASDGRGGNATGAPSAPITPAPEPSGNATTPTTTSGNATTLAPAPANATTPASGDAAAASTNNASAVGDDAPAAPAIATSGATSLGDPAPSREAAAGDPGAPASTLEEASTGSLDGASRAPLPLRSAALAAGLAAVSVTAAAGLAGLSRREAWRYALLAPLVRLYSRLARTEVLDHATRDRLVALVAERPGITYTALLRETRLNRGALLHHLHVLGQHHLLQSRREGIHRRFYPGGARLPEPAPSVTGAEERVLAILQAGPLTQREIAERLGVSQQGASYHVTKLARRGLLVELAAGGAKRWARSMGTLK